MAHCINLAMQTLLRLLFESHIENLLQKFHSYFAHSLQKNLKFTKLVKLTCPKGIQIFWNVKIRWILMLNPTKRVTMEYIIMLVKITFDSPTN